MAPYVFCSVDELLVDGILCEYVILLCIIKMLLFNTISIHPVVLLEKCVTIYPVKDFYLCSDDLYSMLLFIVIICIHLIFFFLSQTKRHDLFFFCYFVLNTVFFVLFSLCIDI